MNNEIYLFDSNLMFPMSIKEAPVKVQLLSLKCHNVRRTGRNTWDFQVLGRDEWYRTHYAWALVLNTPANLKTVRVRNELRNIADQAARTVSLQQEKILTVSAMDIES
jgi:hypothetical protein